MKNLQKMINKYLKEHWGRTLLAMFLALLLPGILYGLGMEAMEESSSNTMAFFQTLIFVAFSLLSALFTYYFSIEIYESLKERRNIRYFGFLAQIGRQGLDMFFLTIVIYIKTLLWTLLFIIPGIVKSLEYQRAIYIKYNHPVIANRRCFKMAKEEMDGNKGKLFWKNLQAIWPLLLGTLLFLMSFGFSLFKMFEGWGGAYIPTNSFPSIILFIAVIIVSVILYFYGILRGVLVEPFFNCVMDDPNFDPSQLLWKEGQAAFPLDAAEDESENDRPPKNDN